MNPTEEEQVRSLEGSLDDDDRKFLDDLSDGIARLKLGRALLRQKRLSESEPELLAGLDIVLKQSSPSVAWAKNGREDLAALYDAMKQPDKAAPYRAALVATQ